MSKRVYLYTGYFERGRSVCLFRNFGVQKYLRGPFVSVRGCSLPHQTPPGRCLSRRLPLRTSSSTVGTSLRILLPRSVSVVVVGSRTPSFPKSTNYLTSFKRSWPVPPFRLLRSDSDLSSCPSSEVVAEVQGTRVVGVSTVCVLGASGKWGVETIIRKESGRTPRRSDKSVKRDRGISGRVGRLWVLCRIEHPKEKRRKTIDCPTSPLWYSTSVPTSYPSVSRHKWYV